MMTEKAISENTFSIKCKGPQTGDSISSNLHLPRAYWKDHGFTYLHKRSCQEPSRYENASYTDRPEQFEHVSRHVLRAKLPHQSIEEFSMSVLPSRLTLFKLLKQNFFAAQASFRDHNSRSFPDWFQVLFVRAFAQKVLLIVVRTEEAFFRGSAFPQTGQCTPLLSSRPQEPRDSRGYRL